MKSPARKSRVFCLQKNISHDNLLVDDFGFRNGAFMKKMRKYGLAILAMTALMLPWGVSAKSAEVPPLFQEIKAKSPLDLSAEKYELMTMKVEGRDVTFRAYTNLSYVAKPVDKEYQTMNIYVPEGYFKGETIHGYTARTAPIFLPNTVGGYMPGKAGTPEEKERRTGGPNAILAALDHGYVVAAPGARGRTNQDKNGKYTGKAPAFIVDMKAAVRYLRHNKGILPGDTEKIISNGTSAGGALSSLIGATGNVKDYEPYLKALGAAPERDDIFASSVYCPITDLDHADMAYEWMFSGVHTYNQRNMGRPPAGNQEREGNPGEMGNPPAGDGEKPSQLLPDNAPSGGEVKTLTKKQIEAAEELKRMYVRYINELELKDEKGRLLYLDEDGTGPFADYIAGLYEASAQKAVYSGKKLNDLTWLKVRFGNVYDVDLMKYAETVGRLKGTPAFDAFDLSSGENQEFGTAKKDKLHFTGFSAHHNTAKISGMADKDIIRMMNPLNYIGAKNVDTAKYWRIRHGAKDTDTTIAVPAVLTLKLRNAGYKVDFFSPWDVPHSGDYDLEELFKWIDSICLNK